MNRSTDKNWELFGKQDPYFGVLTHPRFRKSNLDDASKAFFFDTGEEHIEHVFKTVRHVVTPDFSPRRALDFGCGVGRLVLPLASRCDEVVGVDVSPSMLEEARINCDERQLKNVDFALSSDDLSKLEGTFDFIHSFIVFQHIPVDRGLAIAEQLLKRLEPNGVGVLHFTYGNEQQAQTLKRQIKRFPFVQMIRNIILHRPTNEPIMEMNSYPLDQLYRLLYRYQVRHIQTRLTNHGGHLGVFLYFKREESIPEK